MSIHAVDLACAADSDPTFVGGTNSYVSVWLTNLTAWEPDDDRTQDNDPPTLTNTEPLGDTGTDYWRGGPWRFAWSEDRAILLDNLQGQADAYCPWYHIRWHECFHDGYSDDGNAANCSWDPDRDDTDVRTKGTIPEGI